MATPTIYMTTSDLSLGNPKDVAIDPLFNRILISDSGNSRVVLCNIDGVSLLDTLSTYAGNTIVPSGVTYYNGYYYVCDSGNHTLVRIRARDLTYKDYFGTAGISGNTSAKLDSPNGVTNDGKYLYIADEDNDRIVKLDIETLAYVSETSSINGSLSAPYGIVYKNKGGEALFISDATRVIKCTTDFTYIEQNSADVSTPRHLAFKDDYLYVVDSTIKVLSSDGLTSITSYDDDTLGAPLGIDIIADSMFISDFTNDRITVWRIYNPRDSFTQATPAKFGGEFFDQPMIVVGEDSVIVGATQEYGTPNRWKEENTNNYGFGWTEESDISSTWTEE